MGELEAGTCFYSVVEDLWKFTKLYIYSTLDGLCKIISTKNLFGRLASHIYILYTGTTGTAHSTATHS